MMGYFNHLPTYFVVTFLLTTYIFVVTNTNMRIEFDRTKRDKTLLERGLDFLDAALVFAGTYYTAPDLRIDYGEDRFISIGILSGRTVVIVWTERRASRRIISMRCANEREISRYKQYLQHLG